MINEHHHAKKKITKRQKKRHVINFVLIAICIPLLWVVLVNFQSKSTKANNENFIELLTGQVTSNEQVETIKAVSDEAKRAQEALMIATKSEMEKMMEDMKREADDMKSEVQNLRTELQRVREELKNDVKNEVMKSEIQKVIAAMKNEIMQGLDTSAKDTQVKDQDTGAENDNSVVPETNVETVNTNSMSLDKNANSTSGSSSHLNSDEEPSATSININDSCNYQNSDEWLTGTRIANIDEDMSDDLIKNLIMNNSPIASGNGSKDVLEQTLCSSDSNFIQWKPSITKYSESDQEDEEIKHLAFRLMFLALHEHQYGPARKEAISRYGLDTNCPANNSEDLQSSLKAAGVGKLDYECPNTKYIISTVPEIGFGAAVRSGMQEAFFFGLMTGRVVLFMNSLDYASNRSIQIPMRLASCPRKDIQCMYMPFSPCVITKEDFVKAPILEKHEMKFFRNYGKIDEKYKDEKVIIIEPEIARLKTPPPGVRDKLVEIISSFYKDKGQTSKTNNPWDLDAATYKKVFHYIMDLSKTWLVNQVTTFYILRPNLQTKKNLAKAIDEIFPANFDPATAIGVPIRGSDKCGGESTCMTFDDSMQMVKEFVAKRKKALNEEGKNTTLENIVLTSEDKQIVQARLNFPKNETFPFDFIVNENDAGQGSGFPKDFKPGSADNVMFSSLVSLQMQMRAESIVLNQCSNFHRLMTDLAINGCGSQNYLEEYKENDNPKYRMTCKW